MTNLPALLFLLPFTLALFVVAVGVFLPRFAWWITVFTLIALTALCLHGSVLVYAEGPVRITLADWMVPLGIELAVDRLAALASCLVSSVALIIIFSCRSIVQDNLAAFYGCALLLISGLMGMVVAGDLFNMFVHVEVASLSAYALVAAGGRGAPRAAFNYLIIGTLGASFYLLGVGFIYAATGTLNMSDASRIFALGEVDPQLMLVAVILIIVGLGVKMALFPLHGWMPAAYATAAPMGAALMAPLVTKVSAYALLRILFFVFGIDYLVENKLLLDALAWAGGIAVVFGGVMAFLQSDLWRLLAYSSISQMGLVAMGFGIANQWSMTGAVLHIANDAIMKGALFLVAALLLSRYGVRRIEDLASLRARVPTAAIVLVIGGLSLIGIPPLAGFFGKWYVLSGAAAEEAWLLIGAIVVSGLASTGYVFRIIEHLFFMPQTTQNQHKETGKSDGFLTAACVVFTVGIVVLGFYSETVVTQLIIPALPPLLPMAGG